MAASSARKARRGNEKGGNRASIASAAVIGKRVEDGGERRGGEVQSTAGVRFHHPDIPACSSAQNPLQQRQAENRKKRGRKHTSRDNDASLGPLTYVPSHIYEQALRQIRDMTDEYAAPLRNTVAELVAKHDTSVLLNPGEGVARGQIFAATESLLTGQDFVDTDMSKFPWSDEQIAGLDQAIVERVLGLGDQREGAPSDTDVDEFLKSLDCPDSYAGGNVDGTSQSVEIDRTADKHPLEGQTNLGKRDGDDDKNDDAKLQEKAGSVSSGTSKQVDVKTKQTDAKNSPDKSVFPASQPIVLPDLSRLQGISNDLKRSLETARNEIGPTQEAVVLQRGATLHASSDGDNSSSESGGKLRLDRLRRTTEGGTFQLKASALRTDQGGLLVKDTRRSWSLNLPVNVAKPQSTPVRSMITRSKSPSTSTEERSPSSNETEERELEYKHRHTFIGTASLDDFLEILEATPLHTTTRGSVAKAFGTLAHSEQLQARQSSVHPDGWNFVTRITRDDILTTTDYLTEARVKLGSVSLGQFLAKIPFNEKGEIPTIRAVEAFYLASHLDTEADRASHSKAKAFRSWLVKNKTSFEDA